MNAIPQKKNKSKKLNNMNLWKLKHDRIDYLKIKYISTLYEYEFGLYTNKFDLKINLISVLFRDFY